MLTPSTGVIWPLMRGMSRKAAADHGSQEGDAEQAHEQDHGAPGRALASG